VVALSLPVGGVLKLVELQLADDQGRSWAERKSTHASMSADSAALLAGATSRGGLPDALLEVLFGQLAKRVRN
jgi:hypothetical protein